MLETLKARKAELEAQGKKGFTLMEMLIVIAIIAILIAIAIPVFTTQLDNANKATDESNIRAGYSEVQSKIMLDNITGNEEFYLLKDGNVATESQAGSVTSGLYSPSTDGANAEIGGLKANWAKGQSVVYKVENGALKEIAASGSSASGSSSGNTSGEGSGEIESD